MAEVKDHHRKAAAELRMEHVEIRETCMPSETVEWIAQALADADARIVAKMREWMALGHRPESFDDAIDRGSHYD